MCKLEVKDLRGYVQDLIDIIERINDNGISLENNFLLSLIHCYVDVLDDMLQEKIFINSSAKESKEISALIKSVGYLKSISCYPAVASKRQRNYMKVSNLF